MGPLQGISGVEAVLWKQQTLLQVWKQQTLKGPEVRPFNVCYDLMKSLECQAKESGLQCEGTRSHMGL